MSTSTSEPNNNINVNKSSLSTSNPIKKLDQTLKSFVKSHHEKINQLIEQIHTSDEKDSSADSSVIVEGQTKAVIEAVSIQFDCYILQLINVIQSQIELLVNSWNYQKNLQENRLSGKEVPILSLFFHPSNNYFRPLLKLE